MREPLPLATIHEAVLDFLRGRDDVVVFGATAVNAYVSEPRMTQDIDIMSTPARELAEELRQHLSERFRITICVRIVGEHKGYRLFQEKETGDRHLADVRSIRSLPPAQRIEGILVLSPVELIARKVIAYRAHRNQPKAGTDMRDLAMLFVTFPELKTELGAVSDAMKRLGATAEEMTSWRELVAQEISPANDDDEFD